MAYLFSLGEQFGLQSTFCSLLAQFLALVEAFLGTHYLAVFRLLETTCVKDRLSKFEVQTLCIGCYAESALVYAESHAE